ncbi:hypothetical protein [Nocardioides caricicola]|uniref:DUF2975 domain-containing protein n=1 Tax=Nocardioides caricicola TaxID=634770 RepID=A0ABW0N102_9ACTN
MRSAFDKLISWTGLALAAVLLVAGGLLTWANTFINDQVVDQLGMQNITMPEGEALASLPEADQDALEPYAGSPMDTGAEAKAYADHYILVHMNGSGAGTLEQFPPPAEIEVPEGPITYSTASDIGRTLSAQVAENPNATEEEKAAADAWMGLRETLFMGNTLRGLLLYGYAFATIGTIAGIAAIVSFAGAAFLLVLFALGLVHARRAARAEVPAVNTVPLHA